MRKRDDMTPLPKRVQWWRRTAERRRGMARAFKSSVRGLFGLAFLFGGAILTSYGVWMIYPPAGYIIAGILLWVIHWATAEEGTGA